MHRVANNGLEMLPLSDAARMLPILASQLASSPRQVSIPPLGQVLPANVKVYSDREIRVRRIYNHCVFKRHLMML